VKYTKGVFGYNNYSECVYIISQNILLSFFFITQHIYRIISLFSMQMQYQPLTNSNSNNNSNVPITPTQAPSLNSSSSNNSNVPITPTQAPSLNSSSSNHSNVPITPTQIPFASSFSQKYDLITDDMFYKRIESCVDAEKDEQINIFFCMYAITHPYFVEGPSVPINEDTNIYGRILSKYGIHYPCLQWLVKNSSNNTFQFPNIKYDCISIPYSYSDFDNDISDDNDDSYKSLETIQFENTVHEYFLSMFSGDVLNHNTDILKTAYKGYYSPEVSDSLTKSVFVIYDFSELYPLLIFKENIRLIINDELNENIESFSPEIIHFFRENHFLTRITDVISPTIGYICTYNTSENKWVNVSIEDIDNIEYMLPIEHHILGCNAYYLSKSPIDPKIDRSKLVKMACIETRIMYEISINEQKEIFYMGDNVADFKYDFQMGLLMSSTFHFKENGTEFIGLKNVSHMHRIFPPTKSSMSAHMTNSLSPDSLNDKKEYL